MQNLNTSKNIIFEEKKVPIWRLFFEQFKSPLIYILLAAVIVTAAIGEYTDSIVIFIALLINALLGFFQEYKAQNILFHLKKLIKSTVVVIRNGTRQTINSEDVLIGDIAILSNEYGIPADGQLIEGTNILINEAILTGESLPVTKRVGDKVLAGTIVVSGIGKVEITNIGRDTEIGKIGTHVTSQEETKSPLQLQIEKLAKLLTFIVVGIVLMIFIIGYMSGYDIKDILLTSIAVAVAAVPEGLVITLTVILAIGMQRILKRKAIVRKLISAETLGSVSTICIDKTGTITKGILSISDFNFVDQDLADYSSILCNNEIDPLEISMLDWIIERKGKEFVEDVKNSPEFERLDNLDFNSSHKYTASLNRFADKNVIFVFGAPEVLLKKSNLDNASRLVWENDISDMGHEGKRVLGFAYKYVAKSKTKLTHKEIESLTWNGILVYKDPVRKDLASTFKQCRTAGIKVKMITGDHRSTAIAVAKEVGLIPKKYLNDIDQIVLTGSELEKLSDDDLKKVIKDIRIFARTSPFQKLRIVNILQELNEVVAMTGDGVNDAPALKSADIGLVVNEASDISKNTADLVLIDSNFKTIVHAIEEGRVIFDNVRKVVLFLLSGSFSEIILIAGSILLKIPLPITAAQILWVNMVEDSLPALSLAFEPKETGIMNRGPRPKHENILNQKLFLTMAAFIIVTDLALLAIAYYLFSLSYDIQIVRTIVFFGLGIDSLLFIFACKSLDKSIFQYNFLSNWVLNLSFIISLLLFAVAIYTPLFNKILHTVPLGIEPLLFILVFGVFNLLTIELIKYIGNRAKRVELST